MRNDPLGKYPLPRFPLVRPARWGGDDNSSLLVLLFFHTMFPAGLGILSRCTFALLLGSQFSLFFLLTLCFLRRVVARLHRLMRC